MRKVSIAITGAVVFLLVGIWAWTADAAALTGSTGAQLGANYSLVEKVGCNSVPDPICPSDKAVECDTNPGAGAIVCRCQSCSILNAPTQEPVGGDEFACSCRSGTCCNPGTGKWCCRP